MDKFYYFFSGLFKSLRIYRIATIIHSHRASEETLFVLDQLGVVFLTVFSAQTVHPCLDSFSI